MVLETFFSCEDLKGVVLWRYVCNKRRNIKKKSPGIPWDDTQGNIVMRKRLIAKVVPYIFGVSGFGCCVRALLPTYTKTICNVLREMLSQIVNVKSKAIQNTSSLISETCLFLKHEVPYYCSADGTKKLSWTSNETRTNSLYIANFSHHRSIRVIGVVSFSLSLLWSLRAFYSRGGSLAKKYGTSETKLPWKYNFGRIERLLIFLPVKFVIFIYIFI